MTQSRARKDTKADADTIYVRLLPEDQLGQGPSTPDHCNSISRANAARLVKIRVDHAKNTVYSEDDPMGTKRGCHGVPLAFSGVLGKLVSLVYMASGQDLLYFDQPTRLDPKTRSDQPTPGPIRRLAINIDRFPNKELGAMRLAVDNDDLVKVILVFQSDCIRNATSSSKADKWGLRHVPEHLVATMAPGIYDSGLKAVDAFNYIPYDHFSDEALHNVEYSFALEEAQTE